MIRKFGFFGATIALVLLTVATSAQSKLGSDYFADTWSVLVKGIPQGDTRMIFVLEKKDTSMSGVVQDSTGTLIAKIDKIEVKDTTATVYFTAQGYDVNLVMNRKDDDHITGNLMGMFDAEGERVKKAK
jgi:hypothetical protein